MPNIFTAATVEPLCRARVFTPKVEERLGGDHEAMERVVRDSSERVAKALNIYVGELAKAANTRIAQIDAIGQRIDTLEQQLTQRGV